MGYYRLKKSINKDKDIILGKIGKKYLCIYSDENDKYDHNKEYVCKEGEEIEPLLSKKGLTRTLIAGPTGAGKSTLLRKMLQKTDKPVRFFSRLDHDDVIDPYINVKRVDCSDLDIDPIDIDELADHIVVLDDTDTFRNKQIVKELDNLADSALETGRHYDIPAIIRTSHFLLNNKKTRQSLLESNCIICFHRSGLKYQLMNYLKTRIGLTPNQIREILNMKGRWLAIFVNMPQCVFTDKEIKMID